MPARTAALTGALPACRTMPRSMNFATLFAVWAASSAFVAGVMSASAVESIKPLLSTPVCVSPKLWKEMYKVCEFVCVCVYACVFRYELLLCCRCCLARSPLSHTSRTERVI